MELQGHGLEQSRLFLKHWSLSHGVVEAHSSGGSLLERWRLTLQQLKQTLEPQILTLYLNIYKGILVENGHTGLTGSPWSHSNPSWSTGAHTGVAKTGMLEFQRLVLDSQRLSFESQRLAVAQFKVVGNYSRFLYIYRLPFEQWKSTLELWILIQELEELTLSWYSQSAKVEGLDPGFSRVLKVQGLDPGFLLPSSMLFINVRQKS